MNKLTTLTLTLFIIIPRLYASEIKPQKRAEVETQTADQMIQAALAQAKERNAIWHLIDAVCSGDISSTKKALTQVQMNKFPKNKDHPLFSTSKPEMLQLLIAHKSDVNVRAFHFNSTVLMDRCDSTLLNDDRIRCVEILLAQPGINVNAQDCFGYTALHRLVKSYQYSEKHFHLVPKLLACGADPYIEDIFGPVLPKFLSGMRTSRGDIHDKTLTLCVAQRTKDLRAVFTTHTNITPDPANMIIAYTLEEHEKEALDYSKKS